jgi:hypothetical protein
MGRLFLLGIAAAAIYGVWGLYSNISKLTEPPVKAEQPVSQPVSVAPEGKDSGASIKTPPAPISSEKKEPLRVLASNHEWIHVEAWAIVGPGDPLPDGSRLESWDKWEAVVVTEAGDRQRWRFRTVGEALAELVPAVAAASGVPISNDRAK